MKRELIGSVLGAVLFFLWGMVFWVVLPVGPIVFQQADEEVALSQQIQRSITRPGSYMIPGMELMTSEPAEYTRRHETGPLATLFVYPAGRPVVSPLALLGGFLTMLGAVFAMAWLLRIAAIANYSGRTAAVLLAGGTGTFLSDLGFPFWYNWPWQPWLASAAFHLLGWLWVALVLAAIVRPLAAATKQVDKP